MSSCLFFCDPKHLAAVVQLPVKSLIHHISPVARDFLHERALIFIVFFEPFRIFCLHSCIACRMISSRINFLSFLSPLCYLNKLNLYKTNSEKQMKSSENITENKPSSHGFNGSRL